MIPQLIDIGNGCPWPVLPPGVHKTTLGKIKSTFAYTPHRKKLFTGFRDALSDLKHAGCKSVYLNGSYTTGKNHPEDFDACWDPTGVEPEKLDPVLLDFSNKRSAQKQKYGGELFIISTYAQPGITFLDFFQTDRFTGQRKGILFLDLKLPVM